MQKQSCHVERPQAHGTKEIMFPPKSSLQRLTSTSQPSCLGLTTSDQCRACGKTASLKHILTGCEYALRSYTWRHNEVLEIFSEVPKIYCEIANKALNIINNRTFQFVKEGNISKLHIKIYVNYHCLRAARTGKSTTDLKHNFIFPTEIALTTKCPDIVIWSIKAKKSFRYWVNGPFWRKFWLGTSA